MFVKTWRLCLAALFVLAMLARLACFTGLIGSDDLWYSRFAQVIASGNYPDEANQWAGRPGVTIPVGFVYRLTGASEASSVALPLLASSASVLFVAAIGARLYGPLAGLVAGLLMCTSPVHVRFASILVPEPMMEFWITFAVWCFVTATERQSRLLATAAGVLAGFAYLTKEIGALVVPALIVAALYIRRRDLAVAVALGALTVPCTEMIAYQIAFDNPLHRLELAQAGAGPLRSIIEKPVNFAERLLKVYPRMMLYPSINFGLHFITAIVTAGIAVLTLPRHRALLVLWAMVPWTFLNFGSASFTHYVPLWTAHRYISMTLPPLFVLGAGVLTSPWVIRHTVRRTASILIVASVMLIGLGCGLQMRGTGWRTANVAALRSAATVAGEKGLRICEPARSNTQFTEKDPLHVWTATLRLLAPQLEGLRGQSGLVLEPNVLGLPTAREGVCPTNDVPAD